VFGISMWEVGIIMVVALIILGPRQLVEAARVAGKLYREIQKMTWEIREQVNLESISSFPDTTHDETEQAKQETGADLSLDQELMPPPGEKSGPDFYADLLEQAAEADAKEEKDAPEAEVGGEDSTVEETKSSERSTP